MSKLLLIIQREYLTRVKKKSFILTTILTPLAFLVFFIIVGFIFSYQSDDKKNIVIVDEFQILNNQIADASNAYFTFSDQSLEILKEEYGTQEAEFDGILVVPNLKNILTKQHVIYYYSDDQLDLETRMSVENAIEKKIRNFKIDELGLDRTELESLNTSVILDPEPIFESDKDTGRMADIIGAAMGGIMGFIMYFVVFLYGMMVMRSVMEEKMNRIVEVMISTVKPFHLMLGKIIGVGGVGLTQIAIWAVLIPSLSLLVNLIFGFDTSSMASMDINAEEMMQNDFDISVIMSELGDINWWMVLPIFVILFLGGYILYSSLFAAVGSAIGDDLGESQSLTLPITIPILLSFYIMFAAIRAPHSSLAIFASIFPLFSPIVMTARLAFHPPAWQIILSIVLLLGTAISFVWISGRIYKVGILMYGKKISLKELVKWGFSRA